MPPRLAVVLGLLAGIATAALAIAAIVAFTPGPVHSTPAPSAPPSVTETPSPSSTPTPVPSSTPTPAPSAPVSPSPSAGPSSPSPSGPVSPSPSAASTAFEIGKPVHFWVAADGIVRAGALGGIDPDSMAASLQRILPGTAVTP